MAMRALKRMRIQQFFKKNKTAQNFYDKAMGAADLGYGMGMSQLAAQGQGMYTGAGLYTGQGEYVKTNDIISGPAAADAVVPSFASSAADAGVLISRREYVSEIYGPPLVGGLPQSFVLQSFAINPGLESTFPWLSQIACNYDEYTIHQLVFTFKSTTTESSNTTNGQVGTVILATNYNAASPNFTDKVTMLQYSHAVSDRLTAAIQHGVECDPSKLSGSPGEYIRNNPVVLNQDLKTYDHGKFQIAVANCASTYANVSIGELWVSYTVELRKPKFYSALGLNISKDIYLSNGGETLTDPMGITSAAGILKGQQNNIGCLISRPLANNTRITFPAAFRGNVRVMFSIGSAILAGVTSTYTQILAGNVVALGGNVSFVPDLYGNNEIPGEVNDPPVGGIFSSSLTQGLIFVAHLSIDIATNGVDNYISLLTAFTAAGAQVPSQAYLEIAEFNKGFSYLATGLGSSQSPVWLNAAGTVVVP